METAQKIIISNLDNISAALVYTSFQDYTNDFIREMNKVNNGIAKQVKSSS